MVKELWKDLYARQGGAESAQKETRRHEHDGTHAHHYLTFGDPNFLCRMHPISSLHISGTFFIGSSL